MFGVFYLECNNSKRLPTVFLNEILIYKILIDNNINLAQDDIFNDN